MTKAEMKTAVEDYVCVLNGDAHRLRLQWIASEPRFSRGGRYLLAIDLLDDASQTSTTVHVMTRATVTRQQLLDLIDVAVDEQIQRPRLQIADTDDETSREATA